MGFWLSEVFLQHLALFFLSSITALSEKWDYWYPVTLLQVLGGSIDTAFVYFLADFYVYVNPSVKCNRQTARLKFELLFFELPKEQLWRSEGALWLLSMGCRVCSWRFRRFKGRGQLGRKRNFQPLCQCILSFSERNVFQCLFGGKVNPVTLLLYITQATGFIFLSEDLFDQRDQ